jgi:hypothetical protein
MIGWILLTGLIFTALPFWLAVLIVYLDKRNNTKGD